MMVRVLMVVGLVGLVLAGSALGVKAKTPNERLVEAVNKDDLAGVIRALELGARVNSKQESSGQTAPQALPCPYTMNEAL